MWDRPLKQEGLVVTSISSPEAKGLGLLLRPQVGSTREKLELLDPGSSGCGCALLLRLQPPCPFPALGMGESSSSPRQAVHEALSAAVLEQSRGQPAWDISLRSCPKR